MLNRGASFLQPKIDLHLQISRSKKPANTFFLFTLAIFKLDFLLVKQAIKKFIYIF